MLIELRFLSKELKQKVEVNVYIPTPLRAELDLEIKLKDKYKVLYLLHGFGDDYKDWRYNSNILDYAGKNDIAIITASAMNSFYVNTPYGKNFYNFFVYELPEILKELLPRLSDKKEDNFIAGLSMGGYGAARIALLNPDKFNAVGLLSGALDIKSGYDQEKNYQNFYNIPEQLGRLNDLKNDDKDLIELIIKKINLQEKFPKIFLACGKEDYIYYQTLNFKQILDKYHLPYHFQEENGVHNWDFWDKQIKLFFDYIKNINRNERND